MNYKVTSPRSTPELLQIIGALQGSAFRFGAGYTDLLLQLERRPVEELTVINLGSLKDPRFNSIELQDGGIRIGALATANAIIDDREIAKRIPVLSDAASQHASRQIRQVATIGGNICTASPAGDMACALVALNARCELLSTTGAVRIVPLSRFIVGVRKTDIRPDEILYGIFIPLPESDRIFRSRFIKVGTRRSMECAVVSLACHILLDEQERIVHAGIAIGSVAPVVTNAVSAGDFLMGRTVPRLTPAQIAEFASLVVSHASPITDIRGSARYRKEVLFNISKSLFEDSARVPTSIDGAHRSGTVRS